MGQEQLGLRDRWVRIVGFRWTYDTFFSIPCVRHGTVPADGGGDVDAKLKAGPLASSRVT